MKGLYIHPLTILLFAFCFITRKLEILLITYAVMLIHELAHLISAKSIGLMPSYIIIQPFGLNLRLKNQIVYSLADEIIVYMSGPLVNAIFALGAGILNVKLNNIWLGDFVVKNLALFIINLLPILPLDGGIILKKILMQYVGYRIADKMMKGITIILVSILTIIGGVLWFESHFNFSILFLCVFLIANIFTQKEKYNIDFIKELMFYKEKSMDYKNKKVKIMIGKKGEPIRSLAQDFTGGSFTIVYIIDEKGNIEDIFTEKELMEMILCYGASATAKRIKTTKKVHDKCMNLIF